jgi:hypothetical protein
LLLGIPGNNTFNHQAVSYGFLLLETPAEEAAKGSDTEQ